MDYIVKTFHVEPKSVKFTPDAELTVYISVTDIAGRPANNVNFYLRAHNLDTTYSTKSYFPDGQQSLYIGNTDDYGTRAVTLKAYTVNSGYIEYQLINFQGSGQDPSASFEFTK